MRLSVSLGSDAAGFHRVWSKSLWELILWICADSDSPSNNELTVKNWRKTHAIRLFYHWKIERKKWKWAWRSNSRLLSACLPFIRSGLRSLFTLHHAERLKKLFSFLLREKMWWRECGRMKSRSRIRGAFFLRENRGKWICYRALNSPRHHFRRYLPWIRNFRKCKPAWLDSLFDKTR